MRCDEAQLAVSARADGEGAGTPSPAVLDHHLATCAACRGFAAAVRDLRSTLRLEPVDRAPDVAAAVVARLRAGDEVAAPLRRGDDEAAPARHGDDDPPRRGSRPATVAGWRPTRRRTAVAAAAATVAGLIGGVTFVGLGDTGRSPAAADVPELVLDAQHDVDTLESRLVITETSPDGEGPPRTFDARLSYRAPESLALTVDETTPGVAPGDRAAGELVVDGDRWWQSIARQCSPAEGRVRCPAGQVSWSRAVTGRPPFSDVTPVPLDLVSPVDSFALAAAPGDAGDRTIAGRRAVGVTVTVAQVAPLLDGLATAVTLAPVHPTDPVGLWLDADSLVPLALTVRAATGPERAGWSGATGAAGRPGEVVLRVEAVEMAINDPAAAPELPGAAHGGDGQATDDGAAGGADAGFRPAPDDDPVLAAAPVPADLPAGLRAHRAGVVTTPGGPAVGVRSWSDGRAWLTVQATSAWPGGRLFGGLDGGVVHTGLGPAGHAYLSDDGAKIALHTGTLDVVVTGSLPPAELRDVAASLGLVGEPVPDGWAEASTSSLDEAAARVPGLLTARATDGFAPEPAVRLDGDTVTERRAGPGARSFTLTQRTADVLPPPTSGDEADVAVRGTSGRYSAERGELEWIEDGRAISLRSASLGLAELVTVAEELEQAS